MSKSNTPIFDWFGDHSGIVVTTVIVLILSVIITSFYLENRYGSDNRVYEDDVLICYIDDSSYDKPNSRQEYYCVNRDTNAKSCEYNSSRGSGSKPPQGCYL